jgi:putative aldouronate transport system permease protein
MHKSIQDRVFNAVNLVYMLLVSALTLYPFLHILAVSLNEARDSARGGITIFPRIISFDSYRTVFEYEGLYHAFIVSILRTLLGTVLFLLVTTLAGYVMTKRQLKGYRFFYMFFVVSMFVSGGLIPTFLLYQQLGIQNTFLVYILPGAFSTYYMILFRTYIIQLPKGLQESAMIDGAGEFTVFFKIVLPLATPILATIGLFVAVNQWNSWQDTLYYTTDPNLETLQYVLMKVLRKAEATQITKQARSAMARVMGTTSITPDSIKMSITIVATVPILCVYPFLQKYFVNGMVLGAVKE